MKKPPGYCLFETALGWCGVAWRDPAQPGAPTPIVRFQLPEASREKTGARLARYTGGPESPAPPAAIADTISRVQRHLRGELQEFGDVPLDLEEIEPFARRVYEVTRQIPAGTTRSYGDLAKSLDRPGAARAVGQALGRNPVALLVPCHRVTAARGSSGGFSAHGGLATKARMLDIEMFGGAGGAGPR